MKTEIPSMVYLAISTNDMNDSDYIVYNNRDDALKYLKRKHHLYKDEFEELDLCDKLQLDNELLEIACIKNGEYLKSRRKTKCRKRR